MTVKMLLKNRSVLSLGLLLFILGDPGADSGGKGKSKWAEK